MVQHIRLPVTDLIYDDGNPRISPLLENWTDPNQEIIGDALQSGDDGFRKLRQAIKTNNGIINPIIVNQIEGRNIVIEGNTRLLIYKRLNKEFPDDEQWQTIPATVYSNLSERQIDAIRLQAHLIGVTNWSAYAKAKYLHHLAKSQHLPINDLIEFCGGNKNEVLRNIDAYEMMENEYRPEVEKRGEIFDEKKFSLFLNVQRPNLLKSILQNGFTREDFINWVVEGKFEPRQEYVRLLPEIMSNPRALKEFQKHGAKKAERYIDRPELKKELLEAQLVDLCEAVQTKIMDIPRKEIQEMRAKIDSRILVETTIEYLQNFQKNELDDR